MNAVAKLWTFAWVGLFFAHFLESYQKQEEEKKCVTTTEVIWRDLVPSVSLNHLR